VLVGKGEQRIVEAITRAFIKAYGREPAFRGVKASAGARVERVG
jgi:hypothetical protein